MDLEVLKLLGSRSFFSFFLSSPLLAHAFEFTLLTLSSAVADTVLLNLNEFLMKPKIITIVMIMKSSGH